MADAQSILTVGLPTLAVVIGILINDYRLRGIGSGLSRFRADMDRGFDEMNCRFENMNHGFEGTNRRFDNMDRGFEGLNRRVDEFRDLLLADFRRVEQKWTARVKHLEEHR